MSDSPLVLLVHGAWHGAWCWAGLQARLEERGVASMAIDLPGHGASTLPFGDLHGDAQYTADVVDAVAAGGRPIVLVGHSYGGAVITEAAVRTASPVAHLVYVAAFALGADESVMGFLGTQPRPESLPLGDAMRMRDDGCSILDRELAGAALYGTSPAELWPAALDRLCPQPMVTFTQPTTGNPRPAIESTYLLCTLDQGIAPMHQEVMATRCTHTVVFETDHSPFMSKVDETAALLASVVEGVRS